MPMVRALAMCLLLAGCGSKGTSTGGEGGAPIATSDMEIGALVTAMDAATVVIDVSLDDGEFFGTEYVLTGGDALSACAQDRCSALRDDFSLSEFPVNVLFPGGYKNTLHYIANEPYVISFSRRTGDQAPRSVVTLPEPFEITHPTDGQQVTDGDLITVVWGSPATESTVVDISAECEHVDSVVSRVGGTRRRDRDADGVLQISVEDVLDNLDVLGESPAPLRRCDFNVAVTQERRGTIDPAFEGGYINGRVVRSVNMHYVPAPQ
jgi:hypothetical protein